MQDNDFVRSSLRLMQRWTPDAIKVSANKLMPAWLPLNVIVPEP